MSERKYSMDEIDRMRSAVKTLTTPIGRSYSPLEVNAQIENRLRTYMQNGTEPQEIEEAVEAHRERQYERQKEIQRVHAQLAERRV